MRKIKRADIKFISLVPKGANRARTIYKADDNSFDIQMLLKGDDIEKGELVAAVYAPNIVDTQGDFATAEVIKQMTYDAARNGLNIDMRHDEKPLTKDQAFIAESFIIQKGDPRFADMKDYDGKVMDVTGGWGVVIKVEDENLRKLYKEGKWGGVSMGGHAELETIKSADDIVQKFIAALSGHTEEPDMKLEEVKALVKEAVAELAKSLKPGAGNGNENQPPAGTEPKPAPVFKGDPTKLEDVTAHQNALKAWELQKDVNWSDPASVSAYQAKLAEAAGNTSEEDEEAGIKKTDDEEVKALKRKLAKAQKKSGQAAGGEKPQANGPIFAGVQLSKEDADAAEAARKSVQAWNKQRGYASNAA